MCGEGRFNENAGRISECEQCPLGKFNDASCVSENAHNSLISCKVCAVDKYQNELGKKSCKTCPSRLKILDNGGDAEQHKREEDCQDPSNIPPPLGVKFLRIGGAQRSGRIDYSKRNSSSSLSLSFSMNSNITWRFDEDADLSQITSFEMELSYSSEFLGHVRRVSNIPPSARSWVTNATTTPLWNEVVFSRMRSVGKLSLKGEWSKVSDRWDTGHDCSEQQYLDDESSNEAKEWRCEECPSGADCTAKSTYFGVKAQFGYFRILPKKYMRCLYAGACLGGTNRALSGRYLSVNGSKDYALLDPPEQCNEDLGFRNGSRLCHGCKRGWRRYSRDECALCSDATRNWLLMVLGSLLILGALAGLVLNAIKEAGRTTVSESVQKIIINYLQVAALFGNFPLRWVRNIYN